MRSLPLGQSQFVWTVNLGGCSATSTTSIRNDEVHAVAGNSQTICENTVVLGATSPQQGAGLWTVQGGKAQVTIPTLCTSPVTNLGSGSNLLRWTVVKDQCSSSSDVVINNNGFSVSAGVDQTVCGSDASVAAVTSENGTWAIVYGSGTIVSPSVSQTSVKGLQVGLNTLRWTVSRNNCTSYSDVNIINNSPSQAQVGDDLTVCTPSTSLVAVSPLRGTGNWTCLGSAKIDAASQALTDARDLTSGLNRFKWTITQGQCSTSAIFNVYNNTVKSEAGTSQFVCDSKATLEGVVPSAGTGAWTVLNSGKSILNDSNSGNSSVSNLDLGDNKFRWTVKSGKCEDASDVSIINNSVTSYAGSDQTVCGVNATVEADQPVQGYGVWSTFNKANALTPSQTRTIVENLASGANTLRWTVTQGVCTAVSELIVYNNSFIANAGADRSVCSDQINLNATLSIGETGVWSLASGVANITIPTSNSALVTNMQKGANVFRWTSTKYGCSVETYVTISNDLPSAAQVGANDEVCYPEGVLSATNPAVGTGVWSKVNHSVIDSPSSNNTKVSKLESGANVFTWTVTNNICSDSKSVTISNNQVFADPGANTKVCASTATLEAAIPTLGVGRWSKTSGNAIIDNSANYITNVSNLDLGANKFVWTVTAGKCSASNEIVMTNNAVTAYAGDNKTVCDNFSSLSAGLPTNGTGVWTRTGSAQIIDETLRNTDVKNLVSGANTFTWTVTKDVCVAKSDVVLTNNFFEVNAGIDRSVCGTDGTLEAVTAGNGTWSNISGAGLISVKSAQYTTVSNLGQGINSFKWEIVKNSCTGSAIVNITNDTPSAAIVLGNLSTCADSSLLSANSPLVGVGVWSNNGLASIAVTSENITKVNYLESGQNTFVWTVTKGNCKNYASMVITNNKVVADAGLPTSVCGSKAVLNAKAVSGAIGYWTNVNNTLVVFDNSTNPNANATGLKSGVNKFKWNVRKANCADSSVVTIMSDGVTANAGVDQTVCSSTATLSANLPEQGTGVWSTSGKAIFSNKTAAVTTVSDLASGANIFRWTVTLGSCTENSIVTIYKNSFSVNAGADITVCSATTNLPAPKITSGTGTWTLEGGAGIVTNPSLNNSEVTALKKGVSTFRWTVKDNGCSGSDLVDVTNASPSDALVGSDQTVCGTTANLSATPPMIGVGIWHSEGTASVVNIQSNNTLVTGLDKGTNVFRWTVTNKDCSVSANSQIVNNEVVADAGFSVEVCGTTATLNAAVPSIGQGTWTTLGSALISNISIHNPVLNNLVLGSNKFTWTVRVGDCSDKSDVFVLNNQVDAFAGENITVCGQTAVLSAGIPNQGIGTWSSSGVASVDVNSMRNSSVSGLGNGPNLFTWTVTKGRCSASSDVVVSNKSLTVNAGSDQVVCGDATTLEAATAGAGSWSVMYGTAVIANSNAYATSVSKLSPDLNTLRWTVTNGDCTASGLVNITNNKPSDASVGTSYQVCDSTATLLANSPLAGMGTGKWSSLGSAKVDVPSLNNSTVSNLEKGDNMFAWTVTKGQCASDKQFIITNNTVSSDAGLNSEVCGANATLNATLPVVGARGAWVSLGNTASVITVSNNRSAVSGLRFGENQFRWTVTKGNCSSSDDVTIVNNGVTSDAGANQTVCSGNASLAAVQPTQGVGMWSVQGGKSTILTSSDNGSKVTDLGLGDNLFRWTVRNGNCSAYTEVTITNNYFVVDAGSDKSVCSETSSLSAVTTSGGIWEKTFGDAVVANASQFDTKISNLSSGVNTFRWTVQKNGCTFSDLVNVTNDSPSDPKVGKTDQVCSSVGYLSAENPLKGVGVWSTDGNASIDVKSVTNTKVTGLEAGANIFTWTIVNNACSSKADMVINNNSVIANAGVDFEVANNEATLTAAVPNTGVTGEWSVFSSAGSIVDPTNYITRVTGLNLGANKFRWTVQKGICSAFDDIVVMNNYVEAHAGSDITACTSTAIISALIPVQGTGVWSTLGKEEIVNNTLNTTEVRGLTVGTHTFRWTVTKGKNSAYDEVVVTANLFDVNAGNLQRVCNTTTTLEALTTDGVGVWAQVSGSGSIDSPSTFRTNVTNLAPGLNTFRWTLKKEGCERSNTVDIYNDSPSTPVVSTNSQVCNGEARINANVPFIGTAVWTTDGKGQIDVPSAANTTVSKLDVGPNKFVWTIQNRACVQSAQMVVTNNHIVANAGLSVEVCGSLATLNAVTPTLGAGVWSKVGGGSIIASPSTATTVISNLDLGINKFTWTVTAGDCSDANDVSVVRNTPTAAQLGNDLTVCTSTATLTANIPAIGVGHWSTLSKGVVIEDSKSVVAKVSNLLSDVPNKFIWTISNGSCSLADTLSVSYKMLEVPNAGKDQVVCTDYAMLAADKPLVVSGYWSKVQGSNTIIASSNNYTTTVSKLDPGLNRFKWTLYNGQCSASSEVVVTNNSFTASAGADRSICADNTSLVVQPQSIGKWTVATGTGTFADATNNITDVADINSGQNTYQWIGLKNGCYDTTSVTITNNKVVVTAGQDVTVCDNFVNLVGTNLKAGQTGLWSRIIGSYDLSSLSTNTTRVSNLNSGNNKYRWSINNQGCITSNDVVVLNNTPSLPYAGEDKTVCEDNTIIVGNQPSLGIGAWRYIGGSKVVIDDPSSFNTPVHNLAPNQYNRFVWSIAYNGCVKEDTIVVKFVSLQALAGDDQTVCSSSVSLKADAPSVGTGKWSTDGGTSTILEATNNNTQATNLPNTPSTFIWTVSKDNCSVNDYMVVTNNKIVSRAGADQTVCTTYANLFAESAGVGTGKWKVMSQLGGGGVLASSNSNQTDVTNLKEGQNTFMWTVTDKGCVDSSLVVITSKFYRYHAGTSRVVCADTVVLYAEEPSYGRHGMWSVEQGTGDFLTPTNSICIVKNLTKGTNIFTWKVTDGDCYSTDQVAIQDDMPTSAYAGEDQSAVCGSIYLNANSPTRGVGVWSQPGGSSQYIASMFNTRVTNLTQGIQNIFRWTITYNQCSTFDEVIVTNQAVTASAQSSQIVCKSSTVLTASDPAPAIGYWKRITGASILESSSSMITNVTNMTSGANTFRWIVYNRDCKDSAEVVITNNSVLAVAGNDQSVCTPYTNLLATLPPYGKGLWTVLKGSAGNFADKSAYNTSVSNLGDGLNKYMWTVTGTGCKDSSIVNILNNSVTSDAGALKNVCDDFTYLGAVSPTKGTGEWTVINSSGILSDPTKATSYVSGLKSGTNAFRWTVRYGICSSVSDVLILNNKPTIAVAGSDQTAVCDNKVLLIGNNPSVGNGVWTNVGGKAVLKTPSQYTCLAEGLGSGPNTFRWTISNADCESHDEVTIINNSVNSIAGDSKTVCSSTSFLLATNPAPYTGSWTMSGGSAIITNSTNYSTDIKGLGNAANTFKWTVYNGVCSSTSTVVVTNSSVTSKAGDGETLCSSSTILNAEPPARGTGVWSVVLGSQGDFDNSLKYNTPVRNLGSGTNTFKWKVSDGNCADSSYTIIQYNGVVANAGTSKSVCVTDAVLPAVKPLVGTAHWSIVSGNATIDNSTMNNTAVHNLSPGVNEFKWTVEKGVCRDSASIVIVNDIPTSSFAGNDVTVCSSSVDLLGNNPTVGKGRWSKISGSSIILSSLTTATTVTNLASGQNTYVWTITQGNCSSSSQVVATYDAVTASAGVNQSVCENQTTLIAVDPKPLTGYWTRVANGGIIENSISFNSKVVNLGSGINTFKWTVVKNKCSASSLVDVTNNYFTTNAGNDLTVCVDTVALNGTPVPAKGVGYWTRLFGTKASIVDSAKYNTVVKGMVYGNNTFIWNVFSNNCVARDTVVITNHGISVSAGTDRSVCSSTATLSTYDPKPGTGVWSQVLGTGNILVTTANQTTVNNLSPGLNQFKWLVTQNECTSTSFVSITNDMPSTAYAGDTISVCGYNAILNATSPTNGVGVWERVAGEGTVVDPNQFNSNVVGLKYGLNTFKWTVTNNTCSSSDQVVVLNKLFVADAGSDQTICSASTILSGINPAPGVGIWTKVGGLGTIKTPTANVTNIDGLANGMNVFRWSVQRDGCSSFDDIIVYNNQPSVDAGLPQNLCVDFTTMEGSKTKGIGTWEVVSGQGAFKDINQYNTGISGIGRGVNTYRWTVVENGCSASSDVEFRNNSVSVAVDPDYHLCADSAVLRGSDPGIGATGLWTVAGGSGSIESPTNYNSKVTHLGTGGNSFAWTVTQGNCSTSKIMTIYNDIPSKAIAGADKSVCTSTSSLFANNPVVGKGSWTALGGVAIISSSSLNNTGVSNLGVGMNKFRWTVTQGNCSSEAYMSIYDNEVISDAGVSRAVCSDTVTLKALKPSKGTGLWSNVYGAGIIADISNNNSKVSGLSLGENRFRWTVSNGICSSYKEIIITNDQASPALVDADKPICENFTTLTAIKPVIGTGRWSLDGGTATIQNATDYNCLVTNIGKDRNTFRWTVTHNACSNYAVMHVDNNMVIASAGATQSVCATSTSLVATSIGKGATGLWSLQSGSAIIITPTSYNTLVEGLSTGATKFKWAVQKGQCTDEDEIFIINNMVPANAGEDQSVCDGMAALKAGKVEPYKAYWSVKGGEGTFDDSTNFLTNVRGLAGGSNKLRWTVVKDGCESYSDVVITNNAVTVVLGQDRIVCSDSVRVIGSKPAPGGTGLWTINGGSGTFLSPSYFVTDLVRLGSKKNTVRWTVKQNGCEGFDEIVLDNKTFVVTAGGDRAICEPVAEIIGTNPEVGSYGFWTVNAGKGVITNSTAFNTTITNLSSGNNIVTWTVVKDDCSSSNAANIVNNKYIAEAGSDRPTCEDSTQLAALNPPVGYGVWSVATGHGEFANSTLNTTVVRKMGSGTNVFRWTIYAGSCSSYDDVTITNNKIMSTAGPSVTTCDSVYVMAATDPGPTAQGQWTIEAGEGYFTSSSVYNTAVHNMGYGANTFVWTVKDKGCYKQEKVTIQNGSFSVSAGDDKNTTENNIQLKGEAPAAIDSLEWKLIGGGDVRSTEILTKDRLSTTVINLDYGVNTFKLKVYKGQCSSEALVRVNYVDFAPNAGSDGSTCDGTYLLRGKLSYVSSGYWITVSGGGQFDNSKSAITMVRKMSSGVNVYRLYAVKNGYTLSDEVQVVNNQFKAYAGPDRNVCADTVSLSADKGLAADVAEWTVINDRGAGKPVNPKSPTTLVKDLNPGKNSYIWSVTRNGCPSIDTVTITYNQPPIPDFDLAKVAGCSPFTVEVTDRSVNRSIDTSEMTYYWAAPFARASQKPGYAVIYNPFTSADIDSTIKLTVSYAKYGCTASIEKKVKVYAKPLAEFTVQNPKLRHPDLTTVNIVNTSSNGANYRNVWDWGNVQRKDTSYVKTISYTYDPLVFLDGTYKINLEVTNPISGCTDTTSRWVKIQPSRPVARIDTFIQGCAPLTVSFVNKSLYQYPDTGNYWNFGNGALSRSVSPTYTYYEPGTYVVSLQVTGPGGQAYVKKDTVIVHEQPSAFFDVKPDTIMLPNNPVRCFNTSSNATKWLWDFGDKTRSEEEAPVHYYKEPGHYTVKLKVWTEFGCSDSITLVNKVFAEAAGRIKFPTAFTPDISGPGGINADVYNNDVFKPLSSGVKEYHLRIYNRFGELIFISHNPEVGWDGYVNGRLAAQDAYVWKANGRFFNGQLFEMTGSVTLIR